jgi:hypothetical protein
MVRNAQGVLAPQVMQKSGKKVRKESGVLNLVRNWHGKELTGGLASQGMLRIIDPGF